MFELLPGILTTLGISFATLCGVRFYERGKQRRNAPKPPKSKP